MSMRTGIIGALVALLMVLQGCHASVGGGIGKTDQTSPVAQATQSAGDRN